MLTLALVVSAMGPVGTFTAIVLHTGIMWLNKVEWEGRRNAWLAQRGLHTYMRQAG